MNVSTPLLQCRDVQHVLGTGEQQTHVLHGVSLEVHPGEFVALTGSSGSGKSTLLYICGALDKPRSGKVLFQDRDLSVMSDRERASFRGAHLGYIFQFHFLLPEFTVRENVALPLRRQGVAEAAANRAADEALDILGLGPQALRRPTQLSGGQQQRVAIARAIVHKPALLLADEPTGSLDSRNAAAVFAALEHLTVAHGTTIVMVTHDPALAASCSRWVTLADGRIVEERRRASAAAPSSRDVESSLSAEKLRNRLDAAEDFDAETLIHRRPSS